MSQGLPALSPGNDILPASVSVAFLDENRLQGRAKDPHQDETPRIDVEVLRGRAFADGTN